MNNTILIYVFGGIIGLSIIAFAFASVQGRKIKKSKRKVEVHLVKKSSKYSHFEKIYQRLSHFSLTKKYVYQIKRQIERVDLSEPRIIHRKVMGIIYTTLLISLSAVFILLLLDLNIYVIFIALLAVYIIHQQIITSVVKGIDDKLLVQFEKFIGNVRHYYHEHNMIDEAIYDAIEDSDYEISLHGSKMYEILIDHNSEEKVEQYYDSGVNKYFKSFLALCHTVQTFGDKSIEGNSMFLTNLNYLKEEINLELLRRNKIKHLFRSLTFICICPVFFLFPIEKWAVSNMTELSLYYRGAYGFVVKLVVFTSVILGFQLVNRLQVNENIGLQLRKNIEEKFLSINIVKKMIDQHKKRKYSHYKKQENLLKSIGATITIEVFIVKRLIWLGLAFVLSLSVVFGVHSMTKDGILHPTKDLNIVKNSEGEGVISKGEFDAKYVLKYVGKEVDFQQVVRDIKEGGSLKGKASIEIAAKRILKKSHKYNQQYFKWWELLICMGIGYLAFMMPYGLLRFQKQIMLLNMEDEVIQFNTMILMLMYIERISVEDILVHMEMFASVFKESISKCINDFEYGDYEALEQLKVDEPFLPLIRIVENLQASTDRISISKAFDALKSDRLYYKDKRKQDNEIIVDKKGLWGKVIAFTPFTLALVLYLLVPFIHFSITQFMTYSGQISNYL